MSRPRLVGAEGAELLAVLQTLSPKTDAQKSLQSHAIDIAFTIGRARENAKGQSVIKQFIASNQAWIQVHFCFATERTT
jgi:hypothetical protein